MTSQDGRKGSAPPSTDAPPVPHPYTPYPELIINFCPTGMIPTKAMTPHVPIAPAEVVEDACRAVELGASILHLHARDEDGAPTYRARVYEEMILGIRAHAPDAVICVSCSGRNFPEIEKRSEVLGLAGAARPDLASLTMTSLDFPTGPSVNAPDTVLALAETMTTRGIKPEIECFDFGMVSAANLLIGRGQLGPAPYVFNLLLGSRYSVPASARHLANLLVDLPRRSVWAAAGIGLFQLPMNTLAIAMGGHCRVGIEDNIYLDFGRRELATNSALVGRVAEISRMFGRSVATPTRAREMIGLGPAPALAAASSSPQASVAAAADAAPRV